MNYLAHAYLSFNDEHILVGNMISDFIKGKKKFDYSATIQKGIMLHRSIDIFTDAHPSTKAAIEIFKPTAGAYAPVFVDIVYDHFLAKDANLFPENSLEIFSQNVYATLSNHLEIYPEKFHLMLPYMIKDNWLFNYRFPWGIQHSFNAIFRRAKYLEKNNAIFSTFIDHYNLLEQIFQQFFPSIKTYAFAEYKQLTQS